jgi:predicted MPP superfamily phosphohydrolase
MRIFFFLVITYCTANYYLYHKLSAVMHAGMPVTILTGMIVFFMTLTPVLIPMYHHRGSEKSVTLFSYAGYLWLAFLVPFFSIGIILDLYNLVVQHSGFFEIHEISAMMLSSKSTFLAPLLCSFLINIYGYFEARNLRVEHLEFHTEKLPRGTDRIRIAQISDVHLGVIVREKTLDRIIKKIEEEKPDIIVSTGDLIDGITHHIDHLPARLKNLQARLGKYAIMGNHEVYGGIKNAVKFIEDSGFVLLRSEVVTIENSINIAGMDFKGGEARSYSKKLSQKTEHEVLSSLPSGLFTLLLKHRSDVEKGSPGRFDLQLSGHTHKGQIFPMNLATMFIFKYHTGFTRLTKGSAIYVSRGTGTSGPPIRFLSTPEVTIIDIVKKGTLPN